MIMFNCLQSSDQPTQYCRLNVCTSSHHHRLFVIVSTFFQQKKLNHIIFKDGATASSIAVYTRRTILIDKTLVENTFDDWRFFKHTVSFGCSCCLKTSWFDPIIVDVRVSVAMLFHRLCVALTTHLVWSNDFQEDSCGHLWQASGKHCHIEENMTF